MFSSLRNSAKQRKFTKTENEFYVQYCTTRKLFNYVYVSSTNGWVAYVRISIFDHEFKIIGSHEQPSKSKIGENLLANQNRSGEKIYDGHGV